MSSTGKMYQTKQIIYYDLPIQIPKCVYGLKSIYAKDSKEMVAQSTDHVSSTNTKFTIFDQVKQFLKNNHQIPGMAELEVKQEEVLRQLSDLKKQILSIKSDLKINPNLTKPEAAVLPAHSDNLTNLPDLVVNATPINPPYSLEIIQKLLGTTVELKFTTHLHSSVEALIKNAQELDNKLTNYDAKNGVPRINIRLIWKNVLDTELLVSHVPILGEVNLLRYLSRITNSSLSYNLDSDSVEIDSILDLSYLIRRSTTKSERAGYLVTLNKSLGKAQWLGGRSHCSLGDIAAYSALKHATKDNEINANMTKWYQKCEAVL